MGSVRIGGSLPGGRVRARGGTFEGSGRTGTIRSRTGTRELSGSGLACPDTRRAMPRVPRTSSVPNVDPRVLAHPVHRRPRRVLPVHGRDRGRTERRARGAAARRCALRSCSTGGAIRAIRGGSSGSTGSGKSFAASLFALRTRWTRPDVELYLIDPLGEFAAVAQATGGAVVRPAVPGGPRINPLDPGIAGVRPTREGGACHGGVASALPHVER